MDGTKVGNSSSPEMSGGESIPWREAMDGFRQTRDSLDCALDIQLVYIVDAHPDQLTLDNEVIAINSAKISEARADHDHARDEAVELVGQALAQRSAAKNGKKPKTPKKPAKKKPKASAPARVEMSDEERGRSTRDFLASTMAEVRKAPNQDLTKRKDSTKAAEWLKGETKIHVRKGGMEYEEEIGNGFINGLEELDQVVLWIGQVNGPRQAPHNRAKSEKMTFVLEMLNVGRIDRENLMNSEQLRELIEEAKDQGLIEEAEADDPKLTTDGLKYIEEIGADFGKSQERPFKR